MQIPLTPTPKPVLKFPPPAGAHSSCGREAYQHDRHLIHSADGVTLYAVADGHGPPACGHVVADLAVRELPALVERHGLLTNEHHDDPSVGWRSAVAALDDNALALTSSRRVYAGATLCAVVRAADAIICANVGDSRAVVVSVAQPPPLDAEAPLKGVRRQHSPKRANARPLSTDHVPTDARERERIERAGGVVKGGLLNGVISMSRALGDEDLKGHRNHTKFRAGSGPFSEDLFVSEPEVAVDRLRPGDLAVVVATDGVWGPLSNDEVASAVLMAASSGASPDAVARFVVRRAVDSGGRDNATAIVAFLHDEHEVYRAAQAASAPRRAPRLKKPLSLRRKRAN